MTKDFYPPTHLDDVSGLRAPGFQEPLDVPQGQCGLRVSARGQRHAAGNQADLTGQRQKAVHLAKGEEGMSDFQTIDSRRPRELWAFLSFNAFHASLMA